MRDAPSCRTALKGGVAIRVVRAAVKVSLPPGRSPARARTCTPGVSGLRQGGAEHAGGVGAVLARLLAVEDQPDVRVGEDAPGRHGLPGGVEVDGGQAVGGIVRGQARRRGRMQHRRRRARGGEDGDIAGRPDQPPGHLSGQGIEARRRRYRDRQPPGPRLSTSVVIAEPSGDASRRLEPGVAVPDSSTPPPLRSAFISWRRAI